MSGERGASVSQKWLLGILTAVLLSGGAGWMSYVHSQLAVTAEEQLRQRDANAEAKRDTAVIKEKVERLERDTKEIKEDQKEQGKKLDEILRRVR